MKAKVTAQADRITELSEREKKVEEELKKNYDGNSEYY